MCIVVSGAASPCKSIVLSQLWINSFLFFSLKEIKNVSTAEQEATPTRSVPLPMEEEEEGGMVAVTGAVDMVAMLTTSP